MSDKVFKKFERQVAKDFDTQRTPLSGSASMHTMSDTLSKEYYIEAKYRKNQWICNLWKETAALAKKEGKKPLIALKSKEFKGYLIVMHSSAFNQLKKENTLNDEQ